MATLLMTLDELKLKKRVFSHFVILGYDV